MFLFEMHFRRRILKGDTAHPDFRTKGQRTEAMSSNGIGSSYFVHI